ncbi:MAG: DUF1800 family protein, partial [Deltaproteobacteria bacterium]|nr:DUF1800 family protein [Deltaproteobacteria bacterium]
MKSRAVRRLLSGWAFAFAVLLPVPEIAHAAPTGIKVPSGSTFILDGDSGKQFTCAPVRRKLVSGRISRKLFFPSTYTLTDLKEKIKKASGSKKKSLQRKLASETARIRAQDAQCRLGPDPLTQVRRALTESDVRHLYDRAAFGAVTPEIINLGVSQGVGPLVDNLMNPVPSPAVETESSKYLDENFTTDSTNVTDRGVQLWALNNLIKQPNPFHDRFAFLFLHNVLATSMEALTDDAMNPLMVDHLNKIRAGAVSGDYITLLKQISRDPVMLIWLNGNQNTKFKPNENFARELMELFTLSPVDAAGNINYSETTVAQVARACTGWTVQRLNVGDNQFVYSSVFGEQIHDPDPAKVIFEGTPYQGLVNNDFDVIDHIFARHPDVDNYLAERILKEYLNETPSQRVVESLARFLKANNFNVSLALRKVLKSEAFYDAANRNSIV